MRGAGVKIPVNLEVMLSQGSKSKVTVEYKEMIQAILTMAKDAGYKTEHLFRTDGIIKSYKQAATFITQLGTQIGVTLDSNTKKIQNFTASLTQMQGGTRSGFFNFEPTGSLYELDEKTKERVLRPYRESVNENTTNWVSSYREKINELKKAEADYNQASIKIANQEDQRLLHKKKRLGEIRQEYEAMHSEAAQAGIDVFQGQSLEERKIRAMMHDYDKGVENSGIAKDLLASKEQQQNLNQLISLQGQYNNAIRESSIYTESAQHATQLLVENLSQAGISINTESLNNGKIEIENLTQAAQALNMTEEELGLKIDTVNAKFESQQISQYITKIRELHDAQIDLAKLQNKNASEEQQAVAQRRVGILQTEVGEYKRLHPTIAQHAKNLGLVSAEYARYKTQLEYVNAEQKKTESFFGRFKTTFKQIISSVFQAGISWRVFAAAQQALRQSIEIVKDLDKAVTDLRIATGYTSETVKEMLKDYNSLAQQLGTTTTEVAKSADTWLRMGYSAQDTNTLIKNSLILSKVGQLDSAEATKYLVSTMKGFNVTANESIKIIDKLAAVDLESATSAGGLGEALARTAKSAELAGVSIEKAIGYVAVVAETTQRDEATVGESFKTLFARLQKIAAGVDIDDEGESLNEVDTVLRRLGISLTDTSGNFRNMGDVLDEIGAKWQNFSNIEQAQIATAIAGTRQRENFLVLMSQYETALKYTETALNSEGTAMEKFAAYEDSVEAKTQALTAAFEGLINNFTDSEGMKNMLDVGKWLLNFADNASLLKTVLTVLIVQGIMKMTSMLPQLTIQFIAQSNALDGVVLKYHELLVQMNGLNVSGATVKQKLTALTQTLSSSLKTLQPTLIAITIAYTLLKGAINSYVQEQKQAQQTALQVGQDFVTLNSQASSWLQSLKTLRTAMETANKSSDEYLQANKGITEIKKQVVQAFEEQKNAVYDYNKTLEDNIVLLRQYKYEDWEKNNKQDYQKVVNYVQGREQDLSGSLDMILSHPFKSISASLAGMGGAIADVIAGIFAAPMGETNFTVDWGSFYFKEELEERDKAWKEYLEQSAEIIAQGQYNEQYTALIQARKEYEDAVLASDEAIAQGDEEAYQENQKLAEKVYQDFFEVADKMQDIEFDNPYVAQYFQKIIDDFTGESLDIRLRLSFTAPENKQQVADIYQSIKTIFDEYEVPLDRRNIGTLEEYINVLQADKDASDDAVNALKYLQQIADTFNVDLNVLLESMGRIGAYQQSWDSQIEQNARSFEALTKNLKATESAIKTVESAQKEYNEYGAISIDTLMSLLDMGDNYLAMLIDENGRLAINAANHKLDAKAILEAMKARTLSDLEAYLKKLGVESSVVSELTGKYNELSASILRAALLKAAGFNEEGKKEVRVGNRGNVGYRSASESEMEAINQQVEDALAMSAKAQLIDQTIAGLGKSFGGSSGGGGGGGGGGGSSEDTWLKAYEAELAELDHLRAMDKINTKQYYNELQRLTNKYFLGRAKYHDKERENLEKLWDLYKQILDEEKDRYEKTLAYVDAVIDKKIEELEKEKDALKKKNEEKEKELQLEELENNLRKAKQRTMRVYYEDVGKKSADNKGNYIG